MRFPMGSTRSNSFLSLTAVAALAFLGFAGCAQQAAGPTRHHIAVEAASYMPSRVKAKAGQEVVLVFTRTTDQTCGTEVVIPSENNRTVALPLNQPVEVKLVAKEKGEIAFTCGMRMFDGAIIVE